MKYNCWTEILIKAESNGNLNLVLEHPERFDRLKTKKTKQWKRQMRYYLRNKAKKLFS